MDSEIQQEIREGLVKHFLYAIVLIKLQNSNRLSGYDILEFINRKYGILMSAGTVYSLLYMMERKDLIQGCTENGKRTYELTNNGKENVRTVLESKEQIQRFIQNLLDGAQSP